MPSTDTRAALVARMRTVVMYLTGRGMLDGRWFGDDPPVGAGTYWWRAELQEAFDALARSAPEDHARRWNVEETDRGVRLCRGDHERSAACEWEEYVRAPEERGEEP